MKEEVKTDITTDSAENHSGKLENRFDKDKLQKELNYQVKATQEFQTITLATINEKVATHAESKRAEAEQAKAAGNTTKARELEQEAEKWETGGAYRQGVDAITNAVGLALGGSPTAGVITGAISPYINTQIKQATEGNTEANLIAHALWGAVEAYTQGGKAGTGAVAAVTGEVGANIISQNLFGKAPKNLTEAEKRTVSELSQVAAGLAGGLSASSGSSLSTAQAVKTGQGVGKNAVENNYLTKQEAERKRALDEKAKVGTITTEEELERNAIAKKDIETDLSLISVCEENRLSTQCQTERQKLEQAKFSYSGAEYTPTGYNYPTYTRYSDLYSEDYEKVAIFSERYDVLKNAKIKADNDFYNATGIDPSWFGRVDVVNNVVASIAGTRLATTEPSKATQVMPKSSG